MNMPLSIWTYKQNIQYTVWVMRTREPVPSSAEKKSYQKRTAKGQSGMTFSFILFFLHLHFWDHDSTRPTMQ